MAAVRMQSRYWKLVHEALKHYEDKLNTECKRMEKLKENNYLSDEDLSLLQLQCNQIHDNIKRCEAIDELVVAASEKKDSFFSVGIGPDEPDWESNSTNSDEEFLRVLEQID